MSINWDSAPATRCPACDGRGIILSSQWVRLENAIDEALEKLPPADPTKGQWFFTAHSIAMLVAYLSQKGDLEGREVACLGTPTMAIGIAISGLARRVTLLDIDADTVDLVAGLDLGVDGQVYDMCDRLPAPEVAAYDTFLVDPLYSLDHYQVVISRGAQLLRAHPGQSCGYIVIPPAEIAVVVRDGVRYPLSLEVSRMVSRMGFNIEAYESGFVEYRVPVFESTTMQRRFDIYSAIFEVEAEWRSSNLMRVTQTEVTEPEISEEAVLETLVAKARRIGRDRQFVLLPSAPVTEMVGKCNVCKKCMTNYGLEGDELKIPQVETIPLKSWRRNEDNDSLPVTCDCCIGYYDILGSRLVVFQGLISKTVWGLIEELIVNHAGLEPQQVRDAVAPELAESAGDAWDDLDPNQVLSPFVTKLAEMRFI